MNFILILGLAESQSPCYSPFWGLIRR